MSKPSRRVVFAFREEDAVPIETLAKQGCAPASMLNGAATSFAEATLAKKTAQQESMKEQDRRLLALNSSALLKSFALDLFSGRTRHEFDPMLPGLGSDSETNLSDLATLCCPSDSDPVALGLITKGTACSCLVSIPPPSANLFAVKDVEKLLARRQREREKGRNGNGFGLTLGQWVAIKVATPVASDWRGSTGKGSRRGTLAEHAAMLAGPNDGTTVYPHPEFVEAVMRFPISWTDLEGSATPLTPSLRNTSDDASSNT